MKLTDIGEFGFIDRFARKFDHMIKAPDMGIGDDCAILSLNESESHVFTTDLLIENIHFLKDKISAWELGYKSLAVNLSDVASMGARPIYSFLSLGIPKDTEVAYLDTFLSGYKALSEKYRVPLMGGDTTKSSEGLVISVSVVGRCKKSEMHLRSMAKEGDLICVSGNLGDSAGGLKILLDNLELNSRNKALIQRHHCPEPMIHEGMWLARQDPVNAMIDISDGISSDLRHILKASMKSAEVYLDQLPVSRDLQAASADYHWNIFDLAIGGGEDYELLFTVEAGGFEQLNSDFENQFSKPLYAIGKILEGKPATTWYKEGVEINPKTAGFDHFSE